MLQQRLQHISQRFDPYVPRALFGVLAVLLVLLAVNDRNFRPLRNKSEWTAQSNYSQAGAHFAIDRDLETWWSSYYAMTFGMWMQVDVGRLVTLNGIVLHVNKTGKEAQPKEWVVKVSPDGKEWLPVNARKSAIEGTLLLIPFDAVTTRYVQVIQTSISSTPSPWRIYELDLLQPVVPWQLARSTLISLIIGWLFFMTAVLLFRHSSLATPPRSRFAFTESALPMNALFAAALLACAMLLAWGLSVYHTERDELSAHESQYFQQAAFDRYSTQKWVSAYFSNNQTGAYWFSLLAVRGIYALCESQLAAFRLIPSIFGIASIPLLFLTWRAMSRSRLAIWEALAAATFFGLTGWTIFLHRSGDFSAALIFWLLLETWLSHEMLHGRASNWLAVLFSLVAALGVCVHPGLLWLPVGVFFFEICDLRRCAHSPNWLQTSRLQVYRVSDQLRNIARYLLALLPMLAYSIVVIRPKSQLSQAALANGGAAFDTFFKALRVCGLSGIAGMIFFSMALFGFIYLLSERRLGEWFFMASGGVLSVCLAFLSLEYHQAASALLLMLLAIFCAKGISGTLAFLTPRHVEHRRQALHALILVLFAGYLGLSAANALFWGNARLSYDPQTYAAQQSRRQLRTLTAAIHADADDCKTVAAFTERDQERLASIYRLPAGFANFNELLRLSQQGIFVMYLFVDAVSMAQPEVADFLRAYYENLGASASLTLYHLRREFRNLPQRFYPQDLFANTGHAIKDPAAALGMARETTTADQPGLLSFGPFCRVCHPGNYVARFALQVGEPVDDTIATLQVVEGSVEVPGTLTLTGRDLLPAGAYHLIDLPFAVDFSDVPAYRMKRYQFFTQTTGKADLRLNYIELLPQTAEASPTK